MIKVSSNKSFFQKLGGMECVPHDFPSQVARLFEKIQEMVEEENNLVFVLIGEIIIAEFLLVSTLSSAFRLIIYMVIMQMKWKVLQQPGKLLCLVLNLQIQFGYWCISLTSQTVANLYVYSTLWSSTCQREWTIDEWETNLIFSECILQVWANIHHRNVSSGCECTTDSDGQIEVITKCNYYDNIKHYSCYW